MAKKKNKKGKPTTARCINCVFERQYPRAFVDSDEPHFYCGRLWDKLTWWKKMANIFQPTFLDGESGFSSDLASDIIYWIDNHAEFNWFGRDIGKIIEPCPGFQQKEKE